MGTLEVGDIQVNWTRTMPPCDVEYYKQNPICGKQTRSMTGLEIHLVIVWRIG
jgi:hypothetical protein